MLSKIKKSFLIDHTIGTSTGQYIYMDKSFANKDEKARLISPVFKSKSNEKCEFRFFYFYNGPLLGGLNIYMRTKANGPEKLLFYVNEELGNFWERKDIIIDEKEPFQIVIEGVTGSGLFGK